MPFQPGHKLSVGNKGGRPYSKENREKAATLKGICMDWAIEQMKNGNKAEQKDIVLKILPTCMPKIVSTEEEPVHLKYVITRGEDKPVESAQEPGSAD